LPEEGIAGMWCRIFAVVLGALIWADTAAQIAAQKDSANGVIVAVTASNFAPDANVWDFAVALDTHSQDLTDDLAKGAVLVDDKGNEFKALGWEGAAPGGHHRSGVLKFSAVVPRPQAVELRINRPGEARARVFRWELK
jgi:hypothetical protein